MCVKRHEIIFKIKKILGGQVHVLPSNMTLAQGALCEPMSCILHGWNRLKATAGSIKSNSKVLILGAGIIGNLWSSLLHHFGVRKVIVSEPSLDRRIIAEGLGKKQEVKKKLTDSIPKYVIYFKILDILLQVLWIYLI